MRSKLLTLLLALATLVSCAWAQAPNRDHSQSAIGAGSARPAAPETYASWTAPFRHCPLSGSLTDHHDIWLEITIIDGDNIASNQRAAPVLGSVFPVVNWNFAVSTEHTVSMARYTAMAIQGSGPGLVSNQDFTTLQNLAAHLPDDHHQLPPKGRRLVVRVKRHSGMLVRAYDRANLPDGVLQILRLVGDVWPVYPVPEFQPDLRWTDDFRKAFRNAGIDPRTMKFGWGNQRLLTISPDHTLRVIEKNLVPFFDSTVRIENLKTINEPPYGTEQSVLRIEDSKSEAIIHEFYQPQIGRRAVYAYAARFTPDGRYLLVLSSIPGIRVYATETWQPVTSVAWVPAGAVAYYPSADWKHGVVAFPSGEIDLVEAATGRKVARIGLGEDLQSVSFSPDDSAVAVVTVGPDVHSFVTHLRVWDVNTGKLVHELWPQEQNLHDAIGFPFWWPDGKYLVAGCRDGMAGPSVVGIWNVASGRYRGTLDGCALLNNPQTESMLWGTQFYKTCGDGELLRWNVDQAIRKITAFEQSFSK